MELILTIIAVLGILLFLVSYFSYAISGFKHHFVTGIISLLPVLNIVTLPSLWSKSRGNFIMGIVGLIVSASAWFMGANQGTQNLIAKFQNSNESVVLSSRDMTQKNQALIEKPLKIPSTNKESAITTAPAPVAKALIPTTDYKEKNMVGLPAKALYSMSFDPVPVDQIKTLKGRIVEITNQNGEKLEGRIKSVSASSVILEGILENELPLATIKQLKLMVKKANR